jgi:hypothetical protein
VKTILSNTQQIVDYFERWLEEEIGRRVEVSLEMVDLATLKKVQYERDLVKGRSKEISQNFKPLAAGIILVNRVDGMNRRIDGRHRQDGAMQKGIPQLPAVVAHGLSLVEEADLWVAINRNRSMPKSTEALRAEYLAKKPAAVYIVKTSNENGFKFQWQDKKPGFCIDAVSPLNMAQRDGVLFELVDTMKRSWLETGIVGNGVGSSPLVGVVIRGLEAFLFLAMKVEGFDRDRVVKILSNPRDGNPKRIWGDAESRATGRGDIWRHVGQVIHILYDRGLKENKRLPIDCTTLQIKMSGFQR